MKRGEIWTAATAADNARKPSPVVIVQDERLDSMESVTVCLITSDPNEIQDFRVPVASNARNGLLAPSHIMVDTISTLRRTRMGHRIGRLDAEDIARLDRAIIDFLGLGGQSGGS